jgi:hypothetical protein
MLPNMSNRSIGLAVIAVSILAALPAGADSLGLDHETPPDVFTACRDLTSAREFRKLVEQAFQLHSTSLKLPEGCANAKMTVAPPIEETDIPPLTENRGSTDQTDDHYYRARITLENGASGIEIVVISRQYLEALHRQHLEDLKNSARP